MALAFNIKILLTVAKDTLTFLSGKWDKKRDAIITAHMTINTAFIKTYDYIVNRRGLYETNLELANAWNEAAASVMSIDEGLGEQLYHKSRFWLDPELFQNLHREDEIIDLNEIVDEMEKLRNLL